MKKKFKIITLLFLLVFLSIGIFFTSKFLLVHREKKDIVGLSILEGTIRIVILSPEINFSVVEPKNITYYFENREGPFTLWLNIIQYSPIVEKWSYFLWSLKDNQLYSFNLDFQPNITFNASKGSNRLVVYANNSNNISGTQEVFFSVAVPNSAPILINIENESYVCENNYTNIKVSAYDIDEEELIFAIEPINPFFLAGNWKEGNKTITYNRIYSGIIRKNRVGNYSINLSVTDGEYCDFKIINISVIEINNAPTLYLENITINIDSDPVEFAMQINASDIESGDGKGGNLSFNLTILNKTQIFNINETGFINFTFTKEHLGEYEVEVCVTDKPLLSIHPKIEICGENGDKKTTCGRFNLSVIQSRKTPSISIGGAAAPLKKCESLIGCTEWSECYDILTALEEKKITSEQFTNISLQCAKNFKTEGIICGYQERDCFDVNNCTKEIKKEFRECIFVKDANCSDGIKNCHHGSCEILVDCGGPCKACPTCSDGIQNQGEEGIDCGGPCPRKCEIVKLSPFESSWNKILLTLLSLMSLILTIFCILAIRYAIRLREKAIYLTTRKISKGAMNYCILMINLKTRKIIKGIEVSKISSKLLLRSINKIVLKKGTEEEFKIFYLSEEIKSILNNKMINDFAKNNNIIIKHSSKIDRKMKEKIDFIWADYRERRLEFSNLREWIKRFNLKITLR